MKILKAFYSMFQDIPKDAYMHIFFCMLLTNILIVCSVPMYVSGSIVLVLGILKEVVWDKLLKQGTFDIQDLVTDLVGIFLGFL